VPRSKESEGESKDDAESSGQIKDAHKKELSDLDYLKSKVKATDGGEPAAEAPVKEPVKKQIVKKEFFTVKMRGFPCQSKKKDIRKFLEPLKPDSIRLPPKVKGVAYVGFASEKEWKNALNKNRSFHGENQQISVLRRSNNCLFF
jgi:multiple RNA-binding domain-containing protein 1